MALLARLDFRHNMSKKCTAEQVIEAIAGSGGIKTVIAKRLGVNRQSVDNYLTYYPTALKAYNDEVESFTDKAESTVMQAIIDGDVQRAQWWLAKRRKLNFGDSVDVTTAGKPITFTGQIARDDATDDDTQK